MKKYFLSFDYHYYDFFGEASVDRYIWSVISMDTDTTTLPQAVEQLLKEKQPDIPFSSITYKVISFNLL